MDNFKLNNIFEENAKVYQTKPVRATKYQPGMETGWMVYMINKLTKDIKKQSHEGMKNFKSKRGAELGIATLVSLVDICTANNTIAIVTVGPIAKDISDEFELEPRRVAGIMDMFSCVFQGLIPYGAQLISASGLAMISPFAIIKYSVYPYLMGICALVSIYLYWRKRSE